MDSVKPGDTVDVLGVYRMRYDASLNAAAGFPVLATEIVVNSISSRKNEAVKGLTRQDIDDILQLSRHPNIRDRIIASIAPTLCASINIKAAIAYALFGGVPKGRETAAAARAAAGNVLQQQQQQTAAAAAAAAAGEDAKATEGQHVIRGDINVLLLGIYI